MENKKIGIFLLSGLLIGTMLGSGIILLPPIAFDLLSFSALYAWLGIIITGALFAGIFTKLGIDFPGDAGIANAVEYAFGKEFKQLTALFLIFAVFLGPVAVILLAGEYIYSMFNIMNPIFYTIIIFFICLFMLLKNISSLGKITLALSFLITITLFIGAITVLFNFPIKLHTVTQINYSEFGKTVLILFWAMVGWEVVANYTNDVENPKKTLPIAVTLSFITVSIIFLVVAAALQSLDFTGLGLDEKSINLSYILIPFFGKTALPLITFITSSLCITTYVMFTGGVARLINAQAKNGYFPKIFSVKSKKDVPVYAVLLICFIHSFNLLLVYFKLIDIKTLVEFANLFFISNALFGILASIKIYKNIFVFISALILVFILLALLTFSSKVLLFLAFLMLVFTIIKTTMRIRRASKI